MGSAILITYDSDDAVDEAVALCDAAGYRVAYTLRQRFLNRPKYGISEETMRRLGEQADLLDPDVIVYDEVLRPSQNYNLASRLHRNVLDREALILEIFERRASSAESRLQVKMAQMRYESSRAKENVRLAKMGEQPGFMGIGKFEVDVYYNDIKHRMHSVRSKLAKAGRQRMLHRQGRKRFGLKTVSLAGYTSAGKTTLFNALTGEGRQESEELFTTLSTTTRRFTVGGEPFLVSDTVGFISKLPAYMIEAFRSTLEEMVHADVVLVVLDGSDRPSDLRKKYRSCMATLGRLGVETGRIVFVMNKVDRISEPQLVSRARALEMDGKRWVAASATTGHGLDSLREMVAAASEQML
ncbi:MAG: GTPase HflX [Nitrosopumilaceae archaeon]|nr:GTPase HflX [Nitrosopumilaceae archaeon]